MCMSKFLYYKQRKVSSYWQPNDPTEGIKNNKINSKLAEGNFVTEIKQRTDKQLRKS